MTTTTERSAEIRAEYKRNGWNSRSIGVRSEYYSMGSSIHITIKDETVNVPKAVKIAKGAERISRCEMTGEILSGGNRFVSVYWSADIRKRLAARHIDALRATIEKCKARGPSKSALEPIGDTGALLEYQSDNTAHIWNNGRCGIMLYPKGSGVDDAAFHLAVILDPLLNSKESL